jgi:hypothetical protein
MKYQVVNAMTGTPGFAVMVLAVAEWGREPIRASANNAPNAFAVVFIP